MIEPFMKGCGFLQLPLEEKENKNVLFVYLFLFIYFKKEAKRIVHLILLTGEIFEGVNGVNRLATKGKK